MEFCFKVHESYRRVVAICDFELVGKKFEEGKKQLDVRERFYKGEEADEEKILEIMRLEKMEDSTFNIVGEKCVSLALESGLISEGNVGRVDGVPFALVLV